MKYKLYSYVFKQRSNTCMAKNKSYFFCAWIVKFKIRKIVETCAPMIGRDTINIIQPS